MAETGSGKTDARGDIYPNPIRENDEETSTLIPVRRGRTRSASRRLSGDDHADAPRRQYTEDFSDGDEEAFVPGTVSEDDEPIDGTTTKRKKSIARKTKKPQANINSQAKQRAAGGTKRPPHQRGAKVKITAGPRGTTLTVAGNREQQQRLNPPRKRIKLPSLQPESATSLNERRTVGLFSLENKRVELLKEQAVLIQTFNMLKKQHEDVVVERANLGSMLQARLSATAGAGAAVAAAAAAIAVPAGAARAAVARRAAGGGAGAGYAAAVAAAYASRGNGGGRKLNTSLNLSVPSRGQNLNKSLNLSVPSRGQNLNKSLDLSVPSRGKRPA